jgi:hypothetical protein
MLLLKPTPLEFKRQPWMRLRVIKSHHESLISIQVGRFQIQGYTLLL